MSKACWIIAIVMLGAATLAVASGCRSGWEILFCLEGRATLGPFVAGTGELMLTEVMSLVACLMGLVAAYNAYIEGRACKVRLSALFILFFVISLISENNLMRDDIRPQFLLVLLAWLSAELLVARALGAVFLILLGIAVPALGQLGDHTTQIQLENLFDISVSDPILAPWAARFGVWEEPFEFIGWLCFLTSAVIALDMQPSRRYRMTFAVLTIIAIPAIALGNSLLHLRDDDVYEGFRKIGLFTSVAGVASMGAALLLRHGRQAGLARAYCVMFILAAYWIAVYAPAVYTHEHSKTMSSWLWIFPVFAGFYALVSFRRAYARDANRAQRAVQRDESFA